MKLLPRRLPALFLVLCLLLSGCAQRRANPFQTALEQFPDPDPVRGTISYAQMVSDYQRPDLAEMEATAQELMETVNGLSGGPALRALREFEDQLTWYYSMYTLTSVRCSIDRTDAAAQGEYAFFMDSYAQVQDLCDQLYTVVAQGPNVALLEANYYGEDFFQPYQTSGQGNSQLSQLEARQARLVAQYDDLCVGQTIFFGGEERSWSELAADMTLVGERWQAACDIYYETYSTQMGEIFLELLQVREEIAALSGYDSYPEYAYASFGREYTAAQAQAYMEDVITWILPLYQAAEEQGLWERYQMSLPKSESSVRAMLDQALAGMDSRLTEIFQFMERYDLAQLSSSANKDAGAYEVYLTAYETPLLVANFTGTLEDFLTLTHEFGHFCDDYVNWGMSYNMDVAECCSQGLEYLALEYLDGVCEAEEAEQLLGGKLLDTLDLYVWQGLYNAFEDAVYALDPQTLTVEDVTSTFAQVCGQFGFGPEVIDPRAWVDISHFFQQPFYIISYPVSNDVAMQLWMLEREEAGRGVDAFMALLDRPDPSGSLMDTVDYAGLASPFAPGRAEAVARAVGEALELEDALPLAA